MGIAKQSDSNHNEKDYFYQPFQTTECIRTMTITLLNTGETTGIINRIEEIRSILSVSYTTHILTLNHLKTEYCTGCWSCWWKTPGRCALNDDGEKVFEAVIRSDFVVLSSPVVAGFPSAQMKKIMDRLIVLLHPYILLKNGELHHRKRYPTYPEFGLLLEAGPDTEPEDLDIINQIFDRFAINFHSRRIFTHCTHTHTPQQTAHAIGHH